jgi:PAS domain S-box-containing protein
VLAAAVLLFAVVFVLLNVAKDPDHPLTLLFALPIAMIAVELGLAGGLAAAALAVGLFVLWELVLATVDHASVIDSVSRAVAFTLLGGVAGALADNLRRVSADSARLWELSSDLLCTAGFDGCFKRVNVAWERTLGWTRQELLSRPFVEFVHPEDREPTEAEAASLTRSGHRTINFENRYRHKDGGYRTLLWAATSIPEEELIYATARDVTDRKLAEQAAEAARAEAEQANRAKSEFLSRMSHELRTPLNAVLGFGQLLELDDLEPSQREGVEQILKAGRHLLELINEVLDISRIESGTMSMSLEPVHLGSVLAEALSLIRPLADDAAVRLLADPTELADVYVVADHQRLMQVLINLLSNAVKYNRRGGEIVASCEQASDGRIQLAIANTGHGIAPEQLKRLFEPFDRLGAERTDIEGTGLGLALSMRLMEAMGGTIKAESKPEIGTTMRVALDRAQAPREDFGTLDAVTTAANELAGGTIVYIEDNLSNLRLVNRLIERLPGVRLIPAMRASLGVELSRQHHPDLILLDLHLPDSDGREVLRELKRDPATAAIPVVVLSADATPGAAKRLVAAGASDYLTKPIDVDKLLKLLASALRPGPPAEPPPLAVTAPGAPGDASGPGRAD